jgi:hypothetical protein
VSQPAGGAPESDMPGAPLRPMSKSEFFKAYKSKGSHQMYCDVMNLVSEGLEHFDFYI